MPSKENKWRKIETWALIYGILNITITGLGILLGIGFLVYYNITTISGSDKLLMTVIVLCGMSPEVVFLLFSIILVCGICKRKPGLVLTYFIFGVIFLLAASAACIYFYKDHNEISAICLVVNFFISLPLIIVFLTFKKLKNDRGYHYSNPSSNADHY